MRRGCRGCSRRHAFIDARQADGLPLFQSDPVLGSDPWHAGELAQIIGDDDQAFAAGMTADLHVVRTAGRSRALQLRPNLAVMRSRLVSEGQHVETRYEV